MFVSGSLFLKSNVTIRIEVIISNNLKLFYILIFFLIYLIIILILTFFSSLFSFDHRKEQH